MSFDDNDDDDGDDDDDDDDDDDAFMPYLVSLGLSVTNTGLGIKIRVLCGT